MHKIVAFDLDGTIAESKQPVTPEMADVLTKLSHYAKVVIISGGSFARFEDQILRTLKPSPDIILLPTEGSERYEYIDKQWKLTNKQPFPKETKKKVTGVIKEIIKNPRFEVPPYPVGEQIEDRDTEISFAALGQNAPLADKEKWDPDRVRRFRIAEEIESKVPEVDAYVAGTTSVDVLPKGFDKARGLKILLEDLKLTPDDMIFVGDAIVPGGNDYAVFEKGIQSIPVSGPSETMEAVNKMLQEAVTVPETRALPELPKNPVAYFCSEYAFEPNSYMYAGGLGVLAADFVLQAAEMGMDFIGIGLRYGKVIPTGFVLLRDVSVEIPIRDEKIIARVWHRAFGAKTHVLLLDTNIPENTEVHKKITTHLYDIDFYTRIYEQMVLGIGGVRLLFKLGIEPRKYHLNEGHTSFAALALWVEHKEGLSKIVGTKHTILSAAGLLITFKDMVEIIGPYCKEYGVDVQEVCEKGKFELSPDLFSTTKMVMVSSVKKNAVSELHMVYEKKVHPHSTLISITNGVYRKRWQAKELLTRDHAISDEDLLRIKRKLRVDLFSYIETMTGKKFNPDICTLVWARRFAAYKRPTLLFSDLERLKSIVTSSTRPLQIVISGKAHEADEAGQDMVQKILEFSNTPAVAQRIVYLPDYNVASAAKLTKGADIWLNTPELGKEACGTSGMKAGLNGALQLSIRDGWVHEVNLEGRGWALPEEKTVEVLYDLIEHEITPCFYDECSSWTSKMRSTIELIERQYSADRMVREYEEKLYS